MSSKYIPQPITTEDFISNVRFQLEGVEGYQAFFRDGRATDNDAARIKSECLKRAAQDLYEHFRKGEA